MQGHTSRLSPTAPPPGRRPGPALLVGSGVRVVTTVARSLARRGIPCIVVLPPGQTWPVRSRAVSDTVSLEGNEEACAAQLVSLAAVHHASWVAACTDTGLQIVARAYTRLLPHTRVGAPTPAAIKRVLDKGETLAAAHRAGVPVPASYRLETAEDARVADPSWFPLIAKPADKSGAATGHDFKTRLFREPAELHDAFERRGDFGRGLLFQEFCPGVGVGVELLLQRGEVVAAFQHRRVRELPPAGGVAVVARAEPLDPVLLDHAVRLLRELDWEGVAMVEFRHDPATGRTVLMEINGRFWGSIALPVRSGVDFPWLAWAASHDLVPPVRPAYRAGVRVRWTAGALQRLHGVLTGRDDVGSTGIGRLPALGQFLSDFRPGIRSALWQASDPLPAIAEPVLTLKEWLRDALAGTIRRVLPPGAARALRIARSLDGTRRRRFLARQCARATHTLPAAPLPAPARSVLFVCHGNIMRSPTAEVMLRDALRRHGVDGIAVSSAGVYARAGKRADPRMREAARAVGVVLDDHAAQPLTQAVVDAADVIFAMDDVNFVDIATKFPSARHKTRMLGGIRSDRAYVGREIIDPYTGTAADVTVTVQRLAHSIDRLVEALARGMPGAPSRSRDTADTPPYPPSAAAHSAHVAPEL